VDGWPRPEDECAYVPPAPPGGEEDTAPERAIARWRREEGLPVEEASVAAARSNASRRGYMLHGMWLTPEEELELLEESSRPDTARLVRYFEDFTADFCGSERGWREGRRVLRVGTRNPERDRPALEALIGSERVVVLAGDCSQLHASDVLERIWSERGHLARCGITLVAAGMEGVPVRPHVDVVAPDEGAARSYLASRYGPEVRVGWLGPSRLRRRPQPFASWVARGPELTVFYALGDGGERLAGCVAQEADDRVTVELAVLEPVGPRTESAGYTPAHATVLLAEPLGGRAVLDAATGRPRPSWASLRR
jgi:hypothetical protein